MLWGLVCPNMYFLAAVCNLRQKRFLSRDDAKKACRAILRCSPNVLHIFLARNIAKIIDPIVRPVSIDMVYLSARPCACAIYPRQSVRFIPSPVHLNSQIPSVESSGNLSGATILTPINAPIENTGRCVIFQQFLQTLCRDFRHIFISRRPASIALRINSDIGMPSFMLACLRRASIVFGK